MAFVVGTHQKRIRVGDLIEIGAVAWLVLHCFDGILEKTVAGNYPHKNYPEPAVVVPFALADVVVDLIRDNLPLAHPTIAIHLDYRSVFAEEEE